MFNSGEKRLQRFLKYWKKTNYKRMYSYCQKTWRAIHSESHLVGLFQNRELKDYKVIGEIESGVPLLKTFEVKLLIGDEWLYSNINLICEKSAFKPDKKGEWGVNPVSVLNMKYADD